MTEPADADRLVSISAQDPNGGVFVPGQTGLGPGVGASPAPWTMTKIDSPEKLSAAGSGATQLSGRAKALGKQPQEETDAAARSLDGAEWGGQLGEALHHLSNRWSSQADALSRSCQLLGYRCTETSRAYKNADGDSTNTINSAASGANAEAVRKDFG